MLMNLCSAVCSLHFELSIDMNNARNETWDSCGELQLIDILYDHKPLCLNDHMRVCRIPKFKGANLRHLPGVVVGANNKVEWDPKSKESTCLPENLLVPDYAMSFANGKSSMPFSRLWWDETVPTVVTRAEPHNQRIIHPAQDRF